MKTSWLMVGALAAVVGCGSEVTGGGGGSGGGGGAGSVTDGSTADTSGSTQSGETSGESTGETTGVTTTGGTTGGGGNGLGECEQGGGSGAVASSGGTTMCESDFVCDGGNVDVTCTDDGATEVCDCSLDGALVGSCNNPESNGCSFPINCCFELLGGEAEPNPGPYGACENTGGTATSGSGGGETLCGSYYDCEGGQMAIDCSGDDAGALCECSDGQGFLLGTCRQPAVDCDYVGSCCYDIFN